MHKKPLVAVFVLGLLLVATTVSWGLALGPKDDVMPMAKKGTPTPNLQMIPLEDQTATTVQAGTPLVSPGTFCVGNWMGSRYYRFSGTFAGGEIYFVLQDPSLTLPYSWNVAGCTPSYKFNVTAVNMEINKRPGTEGPNPFTFALQPIVFDADLTDPGCPFPGAVKCAGPVYAVTLLGGSTGSTFKINLPFVIECCVDGPYFGAFYLAGTWGTNVANVTTDNYCVLPDCTPPAGYVLPPYPEQSCHQYIYGDDGTGNWFIFDWVVEWAGPYHLRMYSEGYTPDDPATQCTPGVCDYQYWYARDWGGGRMVSDSADLWFSIPNATGTRNAIAVRFVSDGLDTLRSISFKGFAAAGAPDIKIQVFRSTAAQAGTTCWTTEPGVTPEFEVTIPSANVLDDPLENIVPTPDITFGVLNGGLGEDLFVVLSVPNGVPNSVQWGQIGRGNYYPDGCGDEPHTLVNYYGDWWYTGDWWGTQYEIYLDAYICKEVVPIVEDACSPAGPDDWNTSAHDYQRTSATSMNLGNPCKVTEQWSTFMPRTSSFTSPVIAGGKVYVSSDNELNVFDLATGIAGNTVGTFPYTSGQVRSNVTVEGNRVFVAGGTALSISCWDTTLSTPFWSDDLMAGVLTGSSNGPLNARSRFGVSALYTVGADSILVIGTEQPSTSGSGWLYALDATTGFLYGGWGLNPIPLDRGCWMSPSYDGANIYVGTAYYGTIGDGSLYSFDAATGVQNWNYKDAAALDEGWPGGVSVEGDILYGATYYSDAVAGVSSGHRYAINKSSGSAVIAWRYVQGPCLYAAPTIGRNFVYIPQDNPSAGVLMVDKAIGKAVYNWSADAVGSVPQNVTLTCDNFLFAGDRNGYWYLLNASDLSMEWRREFGGILNGTAIAHHSETGDDYAVVNARSSWTGPAGAGVVTGWRFNQTNRPYMRQLVYETSILVPLNSGSGLGPWVENGVFVNDGCVSLNYGTPDLYDPPGAATSFTLLQQKYAAAYVDRKTGSDWVTYFDGGQPSKKSRLAGAGVRADEELTALDQARDDAYAALSTKGTRGATAAGAMADILRTSDVTYSANPLAPGGTENMSWMYNGTDLGRGLDDEYILAVMDDPDFYPEDMTYANMGYPALLVHYVGGCAEENTVLNWNTLGLSNQEKVYNHGAMGDQLAGSLMWGADGGENANNFDGSFLLMGDSSATLGGALFRVDYYDFDRLFLGNPRLSDNQCGFDRGNDVHMGWRRDGTCPGTPVEILGSWVQAGFADTNELFVSTSPLATMGTNILQTEIGANDPMYGDFKLIQWKIQNRTAVEKTGLKAGTYFDWDIVPTPTDNVGLLSDNFNGYAVWDGAAPRYAYGMFNPNMRTAYCGVDPTPGSPYKMLCNLNDTTYNHTPGTWRGASHPNDDAYGWFLCSRPPYRQYMGGPQGTAGMLGDRGGFLINQPFTLPANGEYAVYQALYGVPAAANDVAAIDALGVEVAKRAARWGGFARGDVNDDGCCNLADVCWLQSGNQIYPDTYCGDVNIDGSVTGADVTYLLQYVSGLGPAPLGAFRFSY